MGVFKCLSMGSSFSSVTALFFLEEYLQCGIFSIIWFYWEPWKPYYILSNRTGKASGSEGVD